MPAETTNAWLLMNQTSNCSVTTGGFAAPVNPMYDLPQNEEIQERPLSRITYEPLIDNPVREIDRIKGLSHMETYVDALACFYNNPIFKQRYREATDRLLSEIVGISERAFDGIVQDVPVTDEETAAITVIRYYRRIFQAINS